MNAPTKALTVETEIRALIDSWTRAVRSQDLDAVMSHYVPDLVSFDAVGKLRIQGVDAYRKHWQECLDNCPVTGPMVFEVHDLAIVAGQDMAFAYGFNRCGGTGENGEEMTSWMRMTTGYRKLNGEWKILHEHFSVPFNMEDGKASFGLSPE